MPIDVYCVECDTPIKNGDGFISDKHGIGPLCPDCNEIEKLHEDAERGES